VEGGARRKKTGLSGGPQGFLIFWPTGGPNGFFFRRRQRAFAGEPFFRNPEPPHPALPNGRTSQGEKSQGPAVPQRPWDRKILHSALRGAEERASLRWVTLHELRKEEALLQVRHAGCKRERQEPAAFIQDRGRPQGGVGVDLARPRNSTRPFQLFFANSSGRCRNSIRGRRLRRRRRRPL
jgi:hypothetical protein